MMCLLHMTCMFYHPIPDQLNLKFGEYFHKTQHGPGAQSLDNSVVSLPPALPSITGILECLASIWQFWRLAEQYCPQEYHRRFSAFSQCQTKPAVFLTALWKSQVLSTSQMDKNSRKLKSPSYQTPVQFRKEGCHPPPICTVSEMRMCENSHKQLTARLEAFLKGAVCCSGSCALVAIPLPNQNIFSLMSLF